jgi:arabinofuranosyltransferase
MSRRWTWSAAALLFAALGAVILRLAWISDDAYITLRTVENLLAGHGLVWNVGERAQTYTHPLWLFLLAVARAISGEAYGATLALGVGLSLAAALLLMRLARSAAAAAAVMAALAASRSFTEFSTSGLENPLAHLLLVLLAAAAAAPRGQRQLLAIALLTALLGTTRYDLVLFGGPVLLAAFRGIPRRQALTGALLGSAPLLLWIAFAAVYYGTPLPTTAYSKLIAAGVPVAELLPKGLFYLRFVAGWDPVTVVAILAGTLLGLLRGDLRCRALAIGVLLHCAWVVRVGGDFMAGRFLTPAFAASVAILARGLATMRLSAPLGALAAALLLAFAPGRPPWLRSPAADVRVAVPGHGVSDERFFWYSTTGLFCPGHERPPAGIFSEMLHVDRRTQPIVQLGGMAGILGFKYGPLVHVVDPWLCDPLLMRLPAYEHERIGHFLRRIPEGYLESVATGENRIYHPGLRRYYEALRTVQRLPLFARARWRELLALWTGRYDADLAAFVAEDYRSPPRVAIAERELEGEMAEGTLWFDDPRVRPVYAGGIEVRFAQPRGATDVHVQLTTEIGYTLRFLRNGAEIARAEFDTHRINDSVHAIDLLRGFAGVHEFAAKLAFAGEFDAIWIDAHGRQAGDPPNAALVPAIGSLHLLP